MKTKLISLLASFLLLPSAFAAEQRPNIIIFLADDLGYADIGVNGCKDIPTPNIDSIAKNGVRFTDGYATHCVCSPSRAGLMSGMYQHRFGFEANSGPEKYAADNFGLPREIPTLAEKLKAAGYATGMIGKWHIGFKEGLRPHERGFDYHFGFLSGARTYLPGKTDNDAVIRNGEPVKTTKYLTDEFADEAVHFIERSQGTKNEEPRTKNPAKPFFLYFAFNAVHSPMDANSYSAALGGIADEKRRTYGGMLSGLDAAVGRVLAKVRELGQEDNTLIFFYSDNGGPTMQTTSRNDPLRGYKGQFYEGGIRVPFLMQWKARVKAGATYTQPVMGFDCHATALAASSIAIPTDKPLDGVNLLPFLKPESHGAPHEFLCWRAGTQKAIRVGDWKLVQEGRSGSAELFNLKTDLSETTDLATKEGAKFDELAAKFADWEKGMKPAQWTRQDARTETGAATKKGTTKAGNRIAEALKSADKNNDGKLTREEYPQKELFDAIDADKDGSATTEEVRAYYAQRRTPTESTPVPPAKPAPAPEASTPKPEPSAPTTKPVPVPAPTRAAQGSVDASFKRLDKNGDGKLTRDESPQPESFGVADANKDGTVTPAEFRIYIAARNARNPAAVPPPEETPATAIPAPERPGEPPLKKLPDSDAVRDAAGRGQLFESIHVAGLTDIRDGMNGVAIVDLNHDGRLDIIATFSPVRGHGAAYGPGERLRVWLGEGGFNFKEHAIKLLGSKVTPESFGRGQVPGLADFNGDGFLDIVVTRHARMAGGQPTVRGAVSEGNALLISEGTWDTFRDMSDAMGIRNELAYNRQPSIGDVNGDGWLDLAVGCDNIKNAMGGVPHSRLYVFKPKGAKFEDGQFEDIGGTAFAPDFGGFYHDSARDKAGPDINLRDLDNDGWLDLVVQDRSESQGESARATLFMGKGDGTFDVKPTTFSGLDSNGICGEAADLNGDGLLDLIFAADPDNSGIATDTARYESRVYWNTGEHGAKQNHWLHLNFSGMKDAELIGARVEITADGKKQTRWIHSNHSYKSGGALDAHFGLGKATSVTVKVTLPSGKQVTLTDVPADQFAELDLNSSNLKKVIRP